MAIKLICVAVPRSLSGRHVLVELAAQACPERPAGFQKMDGDWEEVRYKRLRPFASVHRGRPEGPLR